MMVLPDLPQDERIHNLGVGLEGTFHQSAIAAMQETLIHSPLSASFRWLHQYNMERFNPGKYLSEDEWKKSEHYRPGLSFKDGVGENVARLLAERKDNENQRRFVMNSGPQGFASKAGTFGLQIMSAMLDPINVASAFVPVVREMRFARMASQIGVTPARIVRGGIEGAVGAAIVEPIVYAAASAEQADYDFADSLMAVGFGAVFGATLHGVFGKIGDIMRRYPEQTAEAAMRAANAAILQGKRVDVTPIYRMSEIPEGRFRTDAEIEVDALRGKGPTVSRTETQLSSDLAEVQARIEQQQARVGKMDSARRKADEQKKLDALKQEQAEIESRIGEIRTKADEVKRIEDEIRKEKAKRPASQKGQEAQARKIADLERRAEQLKRDIQPQARDQVRAGIRQALDEMEAAQRQGDQQAAGERAREVEDMIAGERGFPRYKSDEEAVRDAQKQARPESDMTYSREDILDLEAMSRRLDDHKTVDRDLEDIDAEILAARETGIVDPESVKAYDEADQAIRDIEKTRGVVRAIATCAIR